MSVLEPEGIRAAAASASSGTGAAFGPARDLSWSERREWFRARLEPRLLAHMAADEVDIHFTAMPRHYWERVTVEEVLWGLETVHAFFKLVASQVPATTPVVHWRQTPGGGPTRVMLCTWDRHGLLAKAAAAFSAVRLNILQADVFTRADNVVLDAFSITSAGGRRAAGQAKLEEMALLLDGALGEPARGIPVRASARRAAVAAAGQAAPRVWCDNESLHHSTLVRIEAPDRLGLLGGVLQAMADAGLSIKQARIETADHRACDTIQVTDECGEKVLDTARLDALRAALQAVLAQ